MRFVELPNGDIMEDTARFSFDGVLLKENARPTRIFVRFAANLIAFESVPLFTILVLISKSAGSKFTRNLS